MARTLCILAALTVMVLPALADDVTLTTGVSYNNAKITGFENGELVIEVNGNVIHKALDQIRKIVVTAQDSFNDGEKQTADKKYADAVKSYDTAVDRVGDVDWLKQLTTVRRLKALGQAGMIDRASTEWLALLDQTSNAKYVLALAPNKLAAKGSKENADAIVALEAKEGSLAADSPATSIVRQLLLDLYTKEGKSDKAKALAAKMGSAVKTPEGSNTGSDTKPPVRGGNLGDLLKAAEYNLSHNAAEQALTSLKGALKDYGPEHLPKAMLLMGKAQLELAKAAKDDARHQYLVDAGLNFMRVATFYATLPEAAESLFLAGQVNRQLGNTVAARAAFNRVRDSYKNSPFAAEADKELEKLGGGDAAPAKGGETPKKKPKGEDSEAGNASPE